jgi:hypothetical protein
VRWPRVLERMTSGGRSVLVEMGVVAGFVAFTIAMAAAALWLTGS